VFPASSNPTQMSNKAKVARLVPETPDNSSSEEEADQEGEELQVEFEARSPEEEDYHGIKRLLQQLFLRSASVNVGKVTETILNQKFIGSVIKQSISDNEEEEDGEEMNEVYAISTVINLAEKNKESVAGLRSFLLEQTAAGGDKAVLQYVTNMLNGSVGFLFNERFINIPAQITVPLLETLVTEMRKARDRNLPYDFSHYVMISKLYKTKMEIDQDHQAVVFSNPEEELIVSESELCIDYDVSEETDNDTGGNWCDGVEMTPWRRIVVFTSDKLEQIIESVGQNFPQ